ncbi:uncharacterized protein AMSG_02204 [Thecamonas trahens ATCC 50062]|uniref:RING-type domain-containing protein n=1 Tax=Thecamonas trahens ATCC 50062 TaxID=461836 RepID=A0A0L0DVE9_THETB|nr:hypothetical protein AMSG_02204 [Thecamonas trahens ATCC 50062]KNC56190.1 hypothetical protein AMSG_02204 [Thecamonas trahens ATCC 50062]|eukprot:XP_013761220.1 hypothetical protein AMSG_02204 [Thecamonas trahens ATCC 50062]
MASDVSSERERMVLKELARARDHIPDDELVSCVRELVLVRLCITPYKEVTLQIQFPPGYPASPVVVILKSKALPQSLVAKLKNLCEAEAAAHVAMCQVVPVYDKLKGFMVQNLLIAAWDELVALRSDGGDGEETLSKKIKLYEAQGKVKLVLAQGKYKLTAELTIDNQYPASPVELEITRSNFTPQYEAMFAAHAKELARLAVSGPLQRLSTTKTRSSYAGSTFAERGGRRILGKTRRLLADLEAAEAAASTPEPSKTVEPRRSLLEVAQYLMSSVANYPTQPCQCCEEPVFPADPTELGKVTSKALQVERVYCGHFYHYGCLDVFLNSPPFNSDGKPCPACGKRIFHRKWSNDAKELESGWAHKQARHREIGEVIDFLGEDAVGETYEGAPPPWLAGALARAGLVVPGDVAAAATAAAAPPPSSAAGKRKRKKKKKATARMAQDDMSAFL